MARQLLPAQLHTYMPRRSPESPPFCSCQLDFLRFLLFPLFLYFFPPIVNGGYRSPIANLYCPFKIHFENGMKFPGEKTEK